MMISFYYLPTNPDILSMFQDWNFLNIPLWQPWITQNFWNFNSYQYSYFIDVALYRTHSRYTGNVFFGFLYMFAYFIH